MISVVVAAFDASAWIGPCLRSLLGGSYRGPFEVIVVTGSTDGTARIVEEQFPSVRVCRSPERLFPGEARNLGLAHSVGELVAFLHADCIPDRDWLAQNSLAHRAPTLAVAGVIENGDSGSYGGWASYFCRLTPYMPQPSPRPIIDLPSESLSVKRSAFDSYGPFLEGTYSSASAFGWMLNEQGHAPLVDPSIKVSRVKPRPLGMFLRGEPLQGRYFATVRVREQAFSAPKRMTYALLSPVLPFLLFKRVTGRVLRNRRYMREFVLAAPIVFLGLAAWSYGELRGYLWPDGLSGQSPEAGRG